jgi:hypothetical protein
MQDDHVLVGAVKGDVMVGLGISSRHSRQQDNKGNEFFHGYKF